MAKFKNEPREMICAFIQYLRSCGKQVIGKEIKLSINRNYTGIKPRKKSKAYRIDIIYIDNATIVVCELKLLGDDSSISQLSTYKELLECEAGRIAFNDRFKEYAPENKSIEYRVVAQRYQLSENVQKKVDTKAIELWDFVREQGAINPFDSAGNIIINDEILEHYSYTPSKSVEYYTDEKKGIHFNVDGKIELGDYKQWIEQYLRYPSGTFKHFQELFLLFLNACRKIDSNVEPSYTAGYVAVLSGKGKTIASIWPTVKQSKQWRVDIDIDIAKKVKGIEKEYMRIRGEFDQVNWIPEFKEVSK